MARTLGDTGFEDAVWGNAGGDNHHARGVALRWDVSGLKLTQLPEKLEFQREDTNEKSAWYYNQAYAGRLKLTVTRRNISNEHWNLFLLALRIQICHGTFGAKDQFGLGVLKASVLPRITPLNTQHKYEPSGFALNKCAFGTLQLKKDSRNLNADEPNFETLLRLSLLARIAMRTSLREPNTIQRDWTKIRHTMLGKLNESGSHVNVSAGYYLEDMDVIELRLFVQLSLESSEERQDVMKRLSQALRKLPMDILNKPVKGWILQPPTWEYGGSYGNQPKPAQCAKWLNKLAGI